MQNILQSVFIWLPVLIFKFSAQNKTTALDWTKWFEMGGANNIYCISQIKVNSSTTNMCSLGRGVISYKRFSVIVYLQYNDEEIYLL